GGPDGGGRPGRKRQRRTCRGYIRTNARAPAAGCRWADVAPGTLDVDRPAGDRQRRFLDRLVERRMAVEGAGQILGGTAELHGDHDLVDQVAGVAAENVRAEDPVGRLVG